MLGAITESPPAQPGWQSRGALSAGQAAPDKKPWWSKAVFSI